MNLSTPTIKGIFVNSHINAVRKLKGEDGLKRLAQCYGKPIHFKNSDNLPIRDEVAILECALNILSDTPIPPEQRSFEAGRLHFTNFTTTPLARIIFSVMRHNLRGMLLHAENIAGHVFQGVQFTSAELSPNTIRIVMENNDYPLDHFRGLFYEWVIFAGFSGTVEATEIAPRTYEYIVDWKK